jgi:hypothetical protein
VYGNGEIHPQTVRKKHQLLALNEWKLSGLSTKFSWRATVSQLRKGVLVHLSFFKNPDPCGQNGMFVHLHEFEISKNSPTHWRNLNHVRRSL